jgi:hypothetical protein
MGKKDRPDRSGTSQTRIDPEKSPESRYEQTLESSNSAMAGEDKKKLVELIKDWLREGGHGDAPR